MSAPEVIEIDAAKCERIVRADGWFALRRVAIAVTHLYDRMLSPTGLKITEFGILRVCGQHGRIVVADLARELATNRSKIVRSLRPLMADGLLRRVPIAGRRSTAVELTDAGRKTLAHAIVRWEQAQRDVVGKLGEARWTQLKSALTVLEGLSGRSSPL